MKKILLIDDDRLFLKLLTDYVTERYPGLEIMAYDNALQGLAQINADLDLLLLDLEMPEMDGSKLLAYAKQKGLDKSRIIILSGRDADYLHKCFPMGECLAVLNKHEARQKAVLDMIFNALQHKSQ
ncbi:MAG: response regulator transcription factor [Gammaproteobacteria bacterium]|nr:response regulator transcription factor [Gammaproteobacteria bacterium]NIQ11572.1 response regulator transcription factor [Gammaproteobacteria bacterium]NIU27161.1 response regulator transcription factor [candidate division KSB1 bacterium]NIW17272.1 response regulator [candidate division KSB1 bacterium]NIY20228.1 response regulator [Gammaproteobacteria bacterium]